MFDRFLMLAVFCVLGLAALMVSACSSAPPNSAFVADYHEGRVDVIERALTAILTDKYGYQIIEWEKSDDGRTYSFTSEWNYNKAGDVRFSRQGIRRKVYVDVVLKHIDEIPLDARGSTMTPIQIDSEAPEPRNPELGQPHERTAVYIAVMAERNINVRRPDAVTDEAGDWVDRHPLKPEAQEILAHLRFRMVSRKNDYQRLREEERQKEERKREERNNDGVR